MKYNPDIHKEAMMNDMINVMRNNMKNDMIGTKY